ncbi:MAG TPA: hypothetical protein VNR00_02770 [Opitutus sp.]|nr:hypothetical protein [Opitutus sp.]
MKPETHAWQALHLHAAAQLRPGFAARAVSAARTVAPTFASQCLVSVATAAVCLGAIFFVHTHRTATETAQNLAGWEAIALEAQKVGDFR